MKNTKITKERQNFLTCALRVLRAFRGDEYIRHNRIEELTLKLQEVFYLT